MFTAISKDCPWSYTGQRPHTHMCSAKMSYKDIRPYGELECKETNCAVWHFVRSMTVTLGIKR